MIRSGLAAAKVSAALALAMPPLASPLVEITRLVNVPSLAVCVVLEGIIIFTTATMDWRKLTANSSGLLASLHKAGGGGGGGIGGGGGGGGGGGHLAMYACLVSRIAGCRCWKL